MSVPNIVHSQKKDESFVAMAEKGQLQNNPLLLEERSEKCAKHDSRIFVCWIENNRVVAL